MADILSLNKTMNTDIRLEVRKSYGFVCLIDVNIINREAGPTDNHHMELTDETLGLIHY